MKKIIASIALLSILIPAYAATAFWTGKMVPVTTVTYQQAWNCQYNYAGQTFWQVHAGTCPSSVEVR